MVPNFCYTYGEEAKSASAFEISSLPDPFSMLSDKWLQGAPTNKKER